MYAVLFKEANAPVGLDANFLIMNKYDHHSLMISTAIVYFCLLYCAIKAKVPSQTVIPLSACLLKLTAISFSSFSLSSFSICYTGLIE